MTGAPLPDPDTAGAARLLVEPFERLPKREIDAVIDEGERLLGCAAGERGTPGASSSCRPTAPESPTAHISGPPSV